MTMVVKRQQYIPLEEEEIRSVKRRLKVLICLSVALTCRGFSLSQFVYHAWITDSRTAMRARNNQKKILKKKSSERRNRREEKRGGGQEVIRRKRRGFPPAKINREGCLDQGFFSLKTVLSDVNHDSDAAEKLSASCLHHQTSHKKHCNV